MFPSRFRRKGRILLIVTGLSLLILGLTRTNKKPPSPFIIVNNYTGAIMGLTVIFFCLLSEKTMEIIYYCLISLFFGVSIFKEGLYSYYKIPNENDLFLVFTFFLVVITEIGFLFVPKKKKIMELKSLKIPPKCLV